MAQASHCSGELIQRRDVTESLAVFRFSVAEQLAFTAGQFATIGIASDGDLIERPYSITSSPHEPFLEFFVELVPDGSFTPKLWELQLGSTILIRRRIVGRLILEATIKRHLMLATVTGVAPFVSILRTQQAERARGAGSNHQFVVIHGASHSADFGPYLSELEELSQAGWLRYIPTISRPWAEPNWKGETGRVEDVVRKYADLFALDHGNSVGYVCGHPQMIANVQGILERARFLKDQIREEEYFSLHEAACHK